MGLLTSSLPIHFLLFSATYGTTFYQSFFGGIIAYKALPLEHFATLQSKIFPVYFAIQTVGSGLILLTSPLALTRLTGGLLGASFVFSLINSAILGPRANAIKIKRDAQMELEGKHYKDPSASDEMKKINKAFGAVHGVTVLLNLGAFAFFNAYGVILARAVKL